MAHFNINGIEDYILWLNVFSSIWFPTGQGEASNIKALSYKENPKCKIVLRLF